MISLFPFLAIQILRDVFGAKFILFNVKFCFFEVALCNQLNTKENPEKLKVLSRQYRFENNFRKFTFVCISIKDTPTVLHPKIELNM